VIRVCTPPDLPAARLKGAAARTHLQPHITERDTPPRPRTSLTHRAVRCQWHFSLPLPGLAAEGVHIVARECPEQSMCRPRSER